MSWKKGERAEEYVAQKLRLAGWEIRARNFRRKGLEIDLIAVKGERLICVEVKSRSLPEKDDPAQLLRFGKIGRLKMGMEVWLQAEAPEETRNPELWLCSVLLPVSKSKVQWWRLDL